VSIIMTGVAEFRRALDDMVERTNAATRQAVVNGGHLLEAEAKKTLSGSHGSSSGVGRDSRGRFTKSVHYPAPPGSPPNLQTGTLRRSVKVSSPQSITATGWSIEVGPTAVYGRIQELGGWTGAMHATYLPPRPYMAPSLRKVIDDGSLADCYTTAWRTAF
jgi:phage gpG-like protein